MTEPVRSYAGRAHVTAWFDITDADRFECRCGWIGTFKEMDNDFFRELIDGSCPKCDRMLVVRAYPTAEEVRVAAAAGHVEAVAWLEEQEPRMVGQSSP